MTLTREQRLARIESLELQSGSHSPPNGHLEAACVMEAVAYVAGEPWSDHPECASPVISAFLRVWNDGIRDAETRTRLLRPLVPRLVDTAASPDVELLRAFLALDWLARVQLPAWLELAGLTTHAALCRELDELCDAASLRSARSTLDAAGDAARGAALDAALDAARAAAWDAAWDAARATAWDAAYDAAGYAARGAAGYAARAAARAAALDAARGAACDALVPTVTRGQAGDALAPTVERLQVSALELVERMIALGDSP